MMLQRWYLKMEVYNVLLFMEISNAHFITRA